MTHEELRQLDRRYVMQTYGRFDVDLDHGSGATLYEAIGAYDYARQRELAVIVNKAEYAKLMGFLAQADPDAFVTVYTVREMFYRPKPVQGPGKRA